MTSVPPLLRDLDAGRFRELYGCDRFTASVLGNRFRYVMSHMATKLRANAFSPVIRDMDDFCTTISGPPEMDWPMPAASLTNPVHWGPVADSVRIVLEEHGLERLQPGDLVVANDSYRTGKHLNDTSFIRPIFHAGWLIGALHVTAHQLDLGSRYPGGFNISAQTIWEDGLVLTPMLLYRAGVPERATFNLIAANTRYPQMILADLQVIRAALDLGESLLLESIERYGLDAYLGAIRYSCDAAAEAMAQAISVLPDGDYRGEERIDGDGLPESPDYAVAITIRKRGPRLEFDFSGTSEASRTAVNCSWLDVKTGVLMALKLLLDRKSPPNSGAMRNIDIVVPPGTMLNPQPPAATMFYFALVQAIIRATEKALNPALGMDAIAGDSNANTHHHAHGKTAGGEAWGGPSLTSGAGGGGYTWGATRAGDADAYTLLPWMNFPQSGTEVSEQNGLTLLMRGDVIPDTGGAGYHRGGAAHMNDVYWHHGGLHHRYTSQVKEGAFGAFGGRPGLAGADWLIDPDVGGTPRRDWLPDDRIGPLYARSTALSGMIDPVSGELSPDGRYVFLTHETPASAGSISRHISNGGGGWGDPFMRETENVLRDVRDGYVSIAGAARDYGVVVTGDPDRAPERLKIDGAATTALRKERTKDGT